MTNERIEELLSCISVAESVLAYWREKLARELSDFARERYGDAPRSVTRSTGKHYVTVTYPAGGEPVITVEDVVPRPPVHVCPVQMCAEV